MALVKFATLSLMAASIGYWMLSLLGSMKFLLRTSKNQGEIAGPPVSILKPVKGLDPELVENGRSFCRQDHPSYDVIFGVADPQDPALPALRALLDGSSARQHRLVIGPEVYGPNRKVSLLHQMLPFAAHQIVVISDSDVRVGPDYLRHVAPPFLDQSVGLVTCLYRGEGARSFAARLEAWAINATFAPSVMAAYLVEGVTFAFGSTLAIRRTILERAGGFAPFGDLLADDYHLAQEARRQGYRLLLSDYPVACILGRSSFAEVFSRLVRWTRTHRACRPIGYFLSGISHGTVFSILYVVLERFSPSALAIAAAVVGARAIAAAVVDRLILRSRGIGARLWLLLPGDVVNFLAWALSFAGEHVRWRGALYRIGDGGRLVELGGTERSTSSR